MSSRPRSRPHFLRADGPETGVYVRLGSTNRQADRELIAELRLSVEGCGSFDELPMPALPATATTTQANTEAGASRQVLPAAIPELSDGQLYGVQDGGMAVAAFMETIALATPHARKQKIETELISYCRLDAFAMVRLYQLITNSWKSFNHREINEDTSLLAYATASRRYKQVYG